MGRDDSKPDSLRSVPFFFNSVFVFCSPSVPAAFYCCRKHTCNIAAFALPFLRDFVENFVRRNNQSK